jgi:hypothetical protein
LLPQLTGASSGQLPVGTAATHVNATHVPPVQLGPGHWEPPEQVSPRQQLNALQLSPGFPHGGVPHSLIEFPEPPWLCTHTNGEQQSASVRHMSSDPSSMHAQLGNWQLPVQQVLELLSQSSPNATHVGASVVPPSTPLEEPLCAPLPELVPTPLPELVPPLPLPVVPPSGDGVLFVVLELQPASARDAAAAKAQLLRIWCSPNSCRDVANLIRTALAARGSSGKREATPALLLPFLGPDPFVFDPRSATSSRLRRVAARSVRAGPRGAFGRACRSLLPSSARFARWGAPSLRARSRRRAPR